MRTSKLPVQMKNYNFTRMSSTQTITADKILSIDIGGSHIKATILNADGQLEAEYKRSETPKPATVEKVLEVIAELAANFSGYSKISTGFPGYVRNNIVKTAPNLGTEYWHGVDLGEKLTALLGKPARVLNDADMQGLGIARGQGLEMIITLGTGFGTAILNEGILLPHLEMAHHPVTKTRTYDQYIGEKEMNRIGVERWNKRIKKVFSILKTVFNYDHLYIGGGNAADISFKLDDNMTIVNNKDGIKGGAKLWK
jgi:polyphosphate glucokinase